MKHLVKLAAAAAALALCSPAWACSEEKAKTAEATPAKPEIAKAEKKQAKSQKPQPTKADTTTVVVRN
jgi:hypothetical protein